MRTYTAEEITNLNQRLKAARGMHDDRCESLARYLHPAMQGFITGHAPGEQLTEQVFDSTGIESSKALAAFMFTNLTGQNWLKLKWREAEYNDNKQASEWLQETNDILLEAINESNYQSSGTEFFRSIVVFGTAGMSCDERTDATQPDELFKGLVFKNSHMSNLTFMENPNGEVDTILLSVDLTAKQAVEEYGADKLPRDITQAYREGQSTKFEFVIAIYPRYTEWSEYSAAMANGARALPAERKPWASDHVCVLAKSKVKEMGYNSKPRTVVRYAKCAAWDDGYGYGPGDDALPDVKTLNASKRTELDVHDKKLDPPMKTRENNIVGDLHLESGGLTICADPDALDQLLNETDVEWVMLKNEDLTNNIRNAFMVNQLVLPEPGQADMTAYEVSKRIQQMQMLFGATLGRLTTEYMDWIVERSFDLMDAKGQFPARPKGIDSEIDIEYSGPLIQVQKAQGVAAIENWVMMVMQLSETVPTVMDIPNWDDIVKRSARALGVPEQSINSDEQIAETREGRAQQQRMQEAPEALAKTAGAVTQLQQAQGGN